MFMILKRKQILIFTTVLTIIVLVGICIKSEIVPVNSRLVATSSAESSGNKVDIMSGEAVMVSTGDNTDDFFTKAKNDRETVRSKALEILNNTLENESASDEFKKDAETQILQTAKDMDSEKRIESLLAAKGYENSIVFISNEVITVTIGYAADLTESDIARINDIVFEQTGNNNIKIVEVG